MQQRILGTTKIQISALGQGCALFSEGYDKPNDADSLRTLEIAWDGGVTFFDTADAYGFGHNEELLSRFLRTPRPQIVVATKVGLVRKPKAPPRIDNSPEYLRTACDQSLKRLGVEALDLLYLQRHDPEVPIAEVVGTLSNLVAAGKVRALGLSEVSQKTLQEACQVHPIAAVQTEYSLWSRGPELGMLDTCKALGVTFVAYGPLGRGFFGGHVTDINELDPQDFRRFLPRFQPAALAQNRGLLPPLDAFARQRHVSMPQIALAWLLNKHTHVVPIPGSQQSAHVLENIAASELRLTPEEVMQLDGLMPPSAVIGARLPPAALAGIEQP
ncbi:MAG TPA: aldo/keto reductase [Steroidobacteraceae bacterium]